MLLSATKLKAGFQRQGRNIRALLLRDMMMRYGRDNIGFVWAIVEPMILCVGVMMIWSVGGHDKQGVKIVDLVLTGYMPLTMWRHMIASSTKIFRGSTSLLYHRTVSLFDLVFARLGLEFIGATTALLVVWGTLNAAGFTSDIARLDLVLLGWMMMAWFGTASGACIAALTEISETSERFIQPAQYLNIPLSGAFFFLDWIPEWARNYVLIHPHAHIYEVFRAGYFGDSYFPHYDLSYFAACSLTMTLLGVWAVGKVRSRVQLA
jgi:capsular polysaccharide transport system permease protein